MITDVLLNKIVADIDGALTHIALGNGRIPSVSDTKLEGEKIRKVADSYIDQNTIIKELYLDENEGNDLTFTNVGLFGEGATSAIGTGSLMTGGRMDLQKGLKQSVTISLEITVERT